MAIDVPLDRRPTDRPTDRPAALPSALPSATRRRPAAQCETFGAPHLRKSLGHLLSKGEDGELELGYRADLELRTSKVMIATDWH